MRNKFAILLALVLTITSFAVPSAKATDFSYWGLVNQVSSKNQMEILGKLTSAEFFGRQPGFEGDKVTTDYIANYFKTIGLTPAGDNGTFLQTVPMNIVCPVAPIDFRQMDVNKSSLRQFLFMKDYNVLIASGSGNVTAPAFFCGYGITSKAKVVYDDYAGVDVTGKIAVIFRGGPSYFMEAAANDGQLTNLMSFTTKVANAKAHGAVGVILIENPNYPVSRRTNLAQRSLTFYQASLPGLYLSVDTGDIVLAETGKTSTEIAKNIDAQQKPYSFPLSKYNWNIQVTMAVKENYKSANVVGYIPSSDPFGANETLIIDAHWDHLGIDPSGNLYPGAIDNGSGVSVMMEVARVFAQNKVKLDRNLAFVAFTGEESGLVGSGYMANNCPFPEEGLTVLNLDMVGGLPNIIRCASDPNFTDLNSKLKQAGIKVGADFKLGGPANGSSDHYPFYLKGAQAVFVIAADGVTKYHVPEDTIDTVSPEGLELVAKFITHVAGQMTNPFYLSLDNPGPITVGTPEYELTGYTGKNAAVSVGGRNTTASETGRFVLTVPLTKGTQTLNVTAIRPGSMQKLETQITITYELRSKATSSISQINFGYVTKDSNKTVEFTIQNKGEGPLSGTIRACDNWMVISPNKLEASKTVVSVKVDTDKFIEDGFHYCMLQIETDNGMMQLPVTAVTGNPIVSLKTVFGNKQAFIAGTKMPISNPMVSVGKTDFVPMSLISMAFGATFTLDDTHGSITLGDSKITVWPDTNIALVGNSPITLTGNVYGVGSDFMIPVELVTQLGITSKFDDESEIYEFSYDANPFKITTSQNSEPFTISYKNPNIDNASFDVEANRTAQAVISTDSDWLIAWPQTLEIGSSKKTINLKFATNRLLQPGQKTATVKISTAFGSKEVPITVITPSSERIVKIQIGSKTGTIDDKETTLSQPPFIDGGTTMVPYRFLGEAFGATIEWIAESKTVRATLDRTTVELVIGQKTAKVNGVPTTLTKAPIIVKGSTFVPFRFIGEAFKAKVDWYQETKMIAVTMDMNQNNPKLSVKPKEANIAWNDADPDKVPSSASFEIKNEGNGTLQILEAGTLGANLKTDTAKDKVSVSARFNPSGVDENDFVIIKTNAGTEIVPVKVGIYPKNLSILTAKPDGSWQINGLKQNEPYKRAQDLISCSAMRVSGAASGSSLFDGVSNELTITASGHKLWLNVQTGDFSLDDVRALWKFTYNLSETDVSLPIAVYSLAFGWQIKETADGTVKMFIPRDKPSQLASIEKSIDLVWDTTPKRMSGFTAPTYPLKNNGAYSFEKSESKYKLFFFFSNDSVSESIIPYIESINRRFTDSGLESKLVSTTVKSDSIIEQFFAGNQTITKGLSDLSIAGITTPIIFDSEGSICSEFGGEAVPRLYIVDSAGNLIFELSDMDESQIPYLEQAISSLASNSTKLPQDIQSVTIINKGGNAGEGSLSPTNQDITVLKPKFKSSPAKVAVSVSSAPLENEQALPAFKKTTLMLLGNSNQVEIPVRYWKLPKFSMFTSFVDGLKDVRFGKTWRTMPLECTGGDDPVCPISEVISQIGGQTRLGADGKVIITAGDKEIVVTIGSSTAFIGSRSVDLNKPFTLSKGILFGPAKLLSEAIGSKLYRFDDTFCLVSPSLKGSATGPILETNVQSLTFNNYIKPTGGYPEAPDFTLNDYPESTGKSTSLDAILARPDVKVLVIDFWATWCPPCKSGMPYMEKMYREYKDKGLALYGVITDSDTVDDDYVASVLEDDSRIRGGLKKLGLNAITYPMLYENRTGTKIFRQYKGESIPRVVVITKDKKWAFTKVGFWEIGHRNLEFTVRRLLGIEESSKLPTINIRNAGIEELKGTVTCDLPFIVPQQPTFSTMGKTTLTFGFKPNAAPITPQRGTITISTNGGSQTIPVQYNALSEQMIINYSIDVESGETVINNSKVNIIIPSKIVDGKLLLSIDMVMSAIGGQTKILSDKKRAQSIFENWEILFVNGSKDVSVGPITIKANENVVIEGGHVYTDLDTLSYIIDIEYDLQNENKTIMLRYEP